MPALKQALFLLLSTLLYSAKIALFRALIGKTSTTVQQKISSAKNFVKSYRQAVRQEFIFVKRRIARFVFGRSVRLLIVYLHIHDYF